MSITSSRLVHSINPPQQLIFLHLDFCKTTRNPPKDNKTEQIANDNELINSPVFILYIIYYNIIIS